MENIDLMLDEDNELKFSVSIQGTRPGDAYCRYTIEGTDMSYTMDGSVGDDGNVTVRIPSMKKILKEGTYDTRLEVYVDDRYFVPLKLRADFKNSIKVMAESVQVKSRKPIATATLVSAPIQVENKSRKTSVMGERKKVQERPTRKKPKTLTDNDLFNIIRDVVRKEGA